MVVRRDGASVETGGEGGTLNQVAQRSALQPEFSLAHAAPATTRRRERTTRSVVDCGELPFLIRRDGTWLYRGTPIRRKEMVCLFASVLKRAENGDFLLETPCERGRIEVEDAPFIAVELDWKGCGRRQCLNFRTNVDELICADSEHPIRVAHDLLTCDPTPYLRVRPGLGRHPIEARISRSVYYELVALAEPMLWQGRRCLGVWSCGTFFPLGDLPSMDDGDAAA